jgi:hypothetical protein
VEQSVDNPFMALSTPDQAWLAANCSFFNQIATGKFGACSKTLPLSGAVAQKRTC